MSTEELRKSILAELAKYTGKQVPAAFIKRTKEFIPTIDRFHNLITGIFKPAWSEYALSISIKQSSPYEHKDEATFLDDGQWLITYAPRSGGLDMSDNRALLKCTEKKVPLGVFKQMTEKTNKKYGSTYLVMGLGLITNYDADNDVFIIERADRTVFEDTIGLTADEDAH